MNENNDKGRIFYSRKWKIEESDWDLKFRNATFK